MMKEAMAAYNAAVRLDPKSAGVYQRRGNAYRRLGQYHNALSDYNRAIRLDPQVAESYAGRAFAHTLLSQDKEARRDVTRAIELGFEPVLLEREIEELTRRR